MNCRDKNLWFGTDKDMVWRWDGKILHAGQATFTNFTKKDGRSGNLVFCIVVKNNESL
jgi:hypothetical protein